MTWLRLVRRGRLDAAMRRALGFLAVIGVLLCVPSALAVQNGTDGSGEAPWAARIDWSYQFGIYVGRCSGSVIADRWVLTADHCLHTNPKDLNSSVIPASAYTVNINGLAFGLASYSELRTKDVALLKLSSTVKLNLGRPLPLAPTTGTLNKFLNQGVTFFGFGKLYPDGALCGIFIGCGPYPTSVQKTPNGSY